MAKRKKAAGTTTKAKAARQPKWIKLPYSEYEKLQKLAEDNAILREVINDLRQLANEVQEAEAAPETQAPAEQPAVAEAVADAPAADAPPAPAAELPPTGDQPVGEEPATSPEMAQDHAQEPAPVESVPAVDKGLVTRFLAFTLADANIGDEDQKRLGEAGIEKLHELMRRMQSGRSEWFRGIQGVGQERAGKIDDLVADWWMGHAEFAPVFEYLLAA